ncbi:dienelactone hydrolase family protein [Glonium stellatum]|uniref:Dienelactone hydrolase family protein n=1 Tax=Glonium stellatum TaxID=574774 RepID=A0A8E2EZ07_9PEZI|nr:dienelactone hydrolase family protein [Glonium stellatum]
MSGQCCAAGEIHSGTPTGRVAKVHGLDCYIAEPPKGTSPKGVVVIIPDVFGWNLPNSRILADNYATKGGFLVYLPEFMDGNGAPADLIMSIHAIDAGGFQAIWHALKVTRYLIPFRLNMRFSVVKPRIFNFFRELRKGEAANLPVGAAGFCWGGKWTTLLAHDEEKENGKSLVDCTYTAHPSLLAIPDDINKIKIPTSVAAGSLDKRVPKGQMDQVEAILKAKTEKGEGDHELVWYEGAHHGFAVRGSKTDAAENERGMAAEAQAIQWFTKCFEAK